MNNIQITDHEFIAVQKLIFEQAGITLANNKMSLVMSRLNKRLHERMQSSYSDYLQLIRTPNETLELQTAIDLLTTNETYFFREPKHFDFLHDFVKKRKSATQNIRIWSAACSYGQEPYSIAMVLANAIGLKGWEIVATDISTRAIQKAKSGIYTARESEKIPQIFLHKHCLKGIGEYEGSIQICKTLRQQVMFQHLNLNKMLPPMGEFDIIFLRNVMIYFDYNTRAKLINQLAARVKPGGYLIVGHSETLNNLNTHLTSVSPSIYQNVDAKVFNQCS